MALRSLLYKATRHNTIGYSEIDTIECVWRYRELREPWKEPLVRRAEQLENLMQLIDLGVWLYRRGVRQTAAGAAHYGGERGVTREGAH